MARAQRCTGCGHRLPDELVACPNCGRSTGALLVEPIDPEPADALVSGGEVALGQQRRFRPRPGLVALVVAVALVAAVVVLGRTQPATRSSSTTVPSTTVTPTTTVPPVATTLPRYQRAVLGTSGLPGLVLYGITTDGALARADFDAGTFVRRRWGRTPAVSGGAAAVVARDGGAVVFSPGGGVLFVPDGFSRPRVLPTTNAVAVLAATDPQQVWVLEGDTAASPRTARRVSVDGAGTTERAILPAGTRVLGDDGTNGLLLALAGGTYRLDAENGATRKVWPNSVMAWSAAAFVDVVCDDGAQCVWRLVPRNGSPVRSLGALPRWAAAADAALLSPDGRWIAVTPSDPGTPLQLVDTTTGGLVTPDEPLLRSGDVGDGSGEVAWSADGAWLAFLDESGAVRLWRPQGDAAPQHDLDVLGRWSTLAMAPAATAATAAAAAAAPVAG